MSEYEGKSHLSVLWDHGVGTFGEIDPTTRQTHRGVQGDFGS